MTPEQRAQRVHYHEYETLEGIHEHAERIVALEEVATDMWAMLKECIFDFCPECIHRNDCGKSSECYFAVALRELGIEV